MHFVWRWLDRFEETVISIFIGLATVISFTQVLLRYLFSSSITWATEATTFLLIWTALIGASYCVRRKMHIGVDTFVNLLPERFYGLVMVAVSFISVIYTVTLALLGVEFIRFLRMIGQVSPDLEWPMWGLFLVVPLGSLLMTAGFLRQAYIDIVTRPEKKKVGDIADIPPMIRRAQEAAEKKKMSEGS